MSPMNHLTPKECRSIYEDGGKFLRYIYSNQADCTACGGSGEWVGLWIFSIRCSHCKGSGKEPLVKYRRSGSAYLDLKNGIE